MAFRTFRCRRCTGRYERAEHIGERFKKNSIRVGKGRIDKMSKPTTRDYFSMGYYFFTLAFVVFMFFGGLIGEIKPLIAEIIWLFVWGMMFAYAVSLIGADMDSV